MKIKLTAHIKQHAGDILLECQDSFDYNLENLSFAVSDGVSQAYRPELWSRILTNNYVSTPDSFFVQNEVNQFIINPNLGLRLKWDEEEKVAFNSANSMEQFILNMKKKSIDFGAATFIGVKLEKDGIKYQTIGDSVLFFFDYEKNKLSAYSSMIPKNGEMVFTNSPEYIDSNEHSHGKIISGLLPYRNGILFMATDALSDWIMDRNASKKDIKNILLDLMSISSHVDYDRFVDVARNDENPTKLKDDDTTFIALELTDIEKDDVIIEQIYAEKFDNLYFKNLISELKNAKNETDALRRAISKSKRQIEQLTTDLKYAKERDSDKEQEIDKLKSETKSLTTTVTQLKQDLITVQEEKTSLRNSVNTLKDNIRHLKEKCQRLPDENQKSRKKSNTSADKDAVIADLESQLNASQAKEKQAVDELKALHNWLIELRRRSSLSPLDLASLPFLADLGSSTEVQGTTITIGTPTKDGGFKI